jgi:hypothetical protein
MINGWTEVTQQIRNPNYGTAKGGNYHPYWIYQPTGEQECPDCRFRCSVNDMFGTHTCPEMKDGHGTPLFVNDLAYAYANSKIRKVRVLKYKKQTDNIGVEEVNDPSPYALRQDGQPRRYTVTDKNKILRIDE